MVSAIRKFHDTAVTALIQGGVAHRSAHSLEIHGTLPHWQRFLASSHTAQVFWSFGFSFFPSRFLCVWTCGKDQNARSCYACVGFDILVGLGCRVKGRFCFLSLPSRLTPTTYHPLPELMRVMLTSLPAGGHMLIKLTATFRFAPLPHTQRYSLRASRMCLSG